jgi:hypothetical protein
MPWMVNHMVVKNINPTQKLTTWYVSFSQKLNKGKGEGMLQQILFKKL